MYKFIIVFLAISLSLFAEDKPDDTLSFYIGEIIVADESENFFNSINSIRVSADDIRSSDAQNIQETLSNFPGLFSFSDSKNQSELIIRGFDIRQTSIYLDGAPLSGPYDNSVDLSLIPINGMAKIEINKTASPMLYSINSMGGSVRIISDEKRKGIESIIDVGASNKEGAINLSNKGAYKSFFWNVASSYVTSNGFPLPEKVPESRNFDRKTRDNSEYWQYSVFAKAGIKNKRSEIAASILTTDSKKNIPVNIYTEYPRYWRYNKWQNNLINIMYKTKLNNLLTLNGNFYLSGLHNILDSFDDSTFTSQDRRYAFHSTFKDQSYGANFVATFDFYDNFQMKTSAQYRRDKHSEQDDYHFLYEEFESENIGINADAVYSFNKKMQILSGLGVSLLMPVDNIANNTRSALNGSLAWLWQANKLMNIKVNIAYKNRFPTLKELYSKLSGNSLDNPNLSTEKSFNYDLTADFFISDWAVFSASIYRSDVIDLIEVAYIGEDRQFQNIGSSVMQGIELSSYISTEYIKSSLFYSYLYAENAETGERLQNRPEHSFSLHLFDKFEFDFSWQIEIDYYTGINSFDRNNREQYQMDSFATINIKVGYEFMKSSELFFRVNNLTDTYYETDWGMPAPGRIIMAGIRVTI